MQNDELITKLKTQLRYEGGEPFDSSKCSSSLHAKFYEQLYDMQLAVNDCSINELIYTLYTADLLHINIASPRINTNLLSLLVGRSLKKTFGKDQPCEVGLSFRELP